MILLRRLLFPLVLAALALAAWLLSAQLAGESSPLADAGRALAVEQAPLSAPLVSTKRVADTLASGHDVGAMNDALLAVEQSATARSCAVIVRGDETLLAIRPDTPLPPAYTQLLLTGHAALDLLGAPYTFWTQLEADQDIEVDGRLPGSLTLVGGGDPVLMTAGRAAESTLSVWTSFDELADQLVAAGVTSIDGDLVVGDELFDNIRLIPGWAPDWPESQLIGLLGALQVNDGAPAGQTDLSDPGLHAGEHLVALLLERGVTVTGSVRRAEVSFADVVESDTTRVVGQVESAPLRDIVGDMIQRGDPTTAEMLLKYLGFTSNDVGRGGSSAGGGQAVLNTVRALGANLPLSPRDGSGLDPTAQVTCGFLVEFLRRLPAGHPTLDLLTGPDAPTFGGQFDDRSEALAGSLVGGGTQRSRGIAGRVATGEGADGVSHDVISFAALVGASASNTLTASDLLFHDAVLEAVELAAASGGSNP